RHLLPLTQDVARRDDQHHAVAGEIAEGQMGVVRLAADEPEADLAPLHLSHYSHAVADGGTDADVRVLLAEVRERGGGQVFSGNRTGGEEQFTRDRGVEAGKGSAGLPVEVQDSLGEVVELQARLGEQHSTALPPEQGRAEYFFEGVDALAYRRLGQVERL